MVVVDFSEIIVILLLTHYTIHIITILVNKTTRKNIQYTNTRLDKLRCKPLKTVDEQLEFINMKHPKLIGKYKFSLKGFPKLLLSIIFFICIFRLYFYLIVSLLEWDIQLYQAILFIILFPLTINLILEKFSIQKGDISVFFKGGKK